MAKRAGPSEAEFQQQVIQLARLRGWKVAWFRPVRVQRRDGSVYHETPVGADGKGWPDLFMVRRHRAVAAELKVGRNKLSESQVFWLADLENAGIDVYEWRPENWPQIEETLA